MKNSTFNLRFLKYHVEEEQLLETKNHIPETIFIDFYNK